MKNLNGLIAAVILIFSSSVPAINYQGIVVRNKLSSPIPNVLVSYGNTEFRTLTDSSGKFSLDIPETSVRKHISSSKKEMRFFWNSHLQTFNFKLSPLARKVTLFSLNGKTIFCSPVSDKNSVIKIPKISSGIYILNVAGDNGPLFSGKISTFQANRTITFTTAVLSKTAATEKSVKLSFRHDEYYPLELQIFDASLPVTASLKSDPRAFIFDQSKVHSYNFTITKEDSLHMEKYARSENYIPAKFQFDDSIFGTVGFRYKGSSYSLPNCFSTSGERYDKPVCKKISFKVKFNEYDSTARFYKMKALNLHSMSADPTKMHDLFGYQMFRDFGIYAPRTSYARIYINGVFQGVFMAVEKIDGRFTDSRWPENGDGNLYKEQWPSRTNPNFYLEALETNNGVFDDPDVSKMVNLAKTVAKSTESDFVSNVSPFIDLNYFLHYIAVDRAIHNSDGIFTWYKDMNSNWMGNHNFYIYQEDGTEGKIWLIPWDLDYTFPLEDPVIDGAGIPNWNEPAQDCNPTAVYVGSSYVIPPNCDKLTSLLAATLWDKFVSIGDSLLSSLFISDKLLKRADTYSALLDTIIKNDPYVDHAAWKRAVNGFKKDLPLLRDKFYKYIHKIKPEYDTTGFSTPFDGNGFLQTNKVNNFEFTPDTSNHFYATFGTEGSIISVLHNTRDPIWSTADIKVNFIWNQIKDQKVYSEWAGATLEFKETADLRNLKSIQVNLSSDSQRYLYAFIASQVYTRNNADAQYGWRFYVTKEQKIYSLDMSIIDYPDFADPKNPDLLDSALVKADGIGFITYPHYDDGGEMISVPDTGFLKVDNIKFVF
ncbi:MAG: hypothetical protein GX640_08900 [Fibrobacter sp.]|nr:hypothetical protein [Fibrobacter sp.]